MMGMTSHVTFTEIDNCPPRRVLTRMLNRFRLHLLCSVSLHHNDTDPNKTTEELAEDHRKMFERGRLTKDDGDFALGTGPWTIDVRIPVKPKDERKDA